MAVLDLTALYPPGTAERLRRAVLDRDEHRCRLMTDGQRCGKGARDALKLHIGPTLDPIVWRAACPDHFAKLADQGGVISVAGPVPPSPVRPPVPRCEPSPHPEPGYYEQRGVVIVDERQLHPGLLR